MSEYATRLLAHEKMPLRCLHTSMHLHMYVSNWRVMLIGETACMYAPGCTRQLYMVYGGALSAMDSDPPSLTEMRDALINGRME